MLAAGALALAAAAAAAVFPAPKTSPPGFRVESAAGLAADSGGAEEEEEEDEEVVGLTTGLSADEELEEEDEDEEEEGVPEVALMGLPSSLKPDPGKEGFGTSGSDFVWFGHWGSPPFPWACPCP